MENSVRRIYPKILSVITNPCLSHDEKAMLRIATLLNYFMNWGCNKISREVYLPWLVILSHFCVDIEEG